jgi:hypothetical protein
MMAMMLAICLHQRSRQTSALAVFPPPPKYIVIVFMLLMTSTLYFLLPASPLSNLASPHHDLRPFKHLAPTAIPRLPLPPNHWLSSATAVTSCPPQLSLSSAAASYQPLSLSPSHICHCHLLLFAMAASSQPSLSSLVHCHHPLSWLIVTSWNVTLLSFSLSSSLPLPSLPCCFVAVVTISRLHCWPHLSLLLPLCNASKLEARWRGLEIDKVSTL